MIILFNIFGNIILHIKL